MLDLTHVYKLNYRVLPSDLDLNFHMNNGRYLTLMDLGRMDLTCKSGLLKLILKKNYRPVAAAINIIFMKQLSPFESFTLETKVLSWDHEWFYLEQSFRKKNNQIAAHAIVKAAFLRNGKRLEPQAVMNDVDYISSKEAPPFPRELTDLINGEAYKIDQLKDHNKRSGI